jgi:hypothetical protein
MVCCLLAPKKQCVVIMTDHILGFIIGLVAMFFIGACLVFLFGLIRNILCLLGILNRNSLH